MAVSACQIVSWFNFVSGRILGNFFCPKQKSNVLVVEVHCQILPLAEPQQRKSFATIDRVVYVALELLCNMFSSWELYADGNLVFDGVHNNTLGWFLVSHYNAPAS